MITAQTRAARDQLGSVCLRLFNHAEDTNERRLRNDRPHHCGRVHRVAHFDMPRHCAEHLEVSIINRTLNEQTGTVHTSLTIRTDRARKTAPGCVLQIRVRKNNDR
jgi:hypothetical protein